MRITFFIGNGFDLNMGFKTGYDSFYLSLSGDKLDNPIVKSITHDKELWSDMEEGLGNYYNSEVAKNDDYFIEAKHQIELYLEEYLDKVQKQAVYTDTNRISLEMKKSIVDFYKPLNRKCREDIIRIIKGIREKITKSQENGEKQVICGENENLVKFKKEVLNSNWNLSTNSGIEPNEINEAKIKKDKEKSKDKKHKK